MAQHLYTTEACVLSHVGVGESSRLLTLYTRDLGLLLAMGKSVREQRSKLRFSLQPLSCTEVSLVRGRDVWRIVGVRLIRNYSTELCTEPHKLRALCRIWALLRRLIHGEAPQEGVFTALRESSDFVLREPLSLDELLAFERVAVLRLLTHLGYAAPASTLVPINAEPFSRELLVRAHAASPLLLAEINRSLIASDL